LPALRGIVAVGRRSRIRTLAYRQGRGRLHGTIIVRAVEDVIDVRERCGRLLRTWGRL
jgi:hypothetical protein